MVRLYVNEQFPRIATEYLRSLGHDVLTVQEAGNAGKSDPEVLAFAIADNRAILTQNRRDFVRLHRENSEHPGMLICSDQEYLDSSVRLGWLFNPQDQQVEIHRSKQTVEMRSLPTVLSGEEVLVTFELSMPLFLDL